MFVTADYQQFFYANALLEYWISKFYNNHLTFDVSLLDIWEIYIILLYFTNADP